MENRSNVWRLCRDIVTGMRFQSFLLLYSYSNALPCSCPLAYTICFYKYNYCKCCLVFDGYASSRKDKEQLYSTCGVSSNSFLNGSYLIPLLIFLSIHWVGVGKWIEVTSPFTAGLQWLLLNWRRLSVVTA